MNIHGFTGDSANSDVIGRRPNELLIETSGTIELVIESDEPLDEPDNDELAELDVAQVDGAEGELEPDLEAPVLIPRRRSINLQVDALGEEIPSLGVRNVRAIAPGVYALELAQMWQPPAAFGDVEGGWSNRNAPPNRPADGVYLFTVRADMPCRTVSCLATAKLEELPLEVQTFQGSAALMV